MESFGKVPGQPRVPGPSRDPAQPLVPRLGHDTPSRPRDPVSDGTDSYLRFVSRTCDPVQPPLLNDSATHSAAAMDYGSKRVR